MKKKFKLGAFVQATGNHVAGWRHKDAVADAGVNIQHYIDVAQTAEKYLYDFLFVHDTPGGSPELDGFARSRFSRVAGFEPLTLWSAVATHTQNIGFVVTASTTYEEPFHLARRMASLDHVSKGRSAWNLVTTAAESAAGNFGLEKSVEHSLRYARAEEFADVVKGLWDSYKDDAFIRNKETGIFFDCEKQVQLQHKGHFFKVRGPLNVPRSPQGHPVIVQAGASEPGKNLSARVADIAFCASPQLADAQSYYSDLKKRLPQFNRKESDLIVMPGFSPIVGRTQKEALEKQRELDELIHPDVGLALLQRYFPETDLKTLDLDGPPPEIFQSTNGSKSRLESIAHLVKKEKLSLRQLSTYVAGARGHHTLVGTPEMIAYTMIEWVNQCGADGFNIIPQTIPAGLNDFNQLVIPILQELGYFRTEYEGPTLRDNLGLQKPN